MTTYPSFPELSRGFALKQDDAQLDPTIRDGEYENGMDATRARFTRVRRTFSMSIDLMGEADRTALEDFTNDMRSGAAQGALPFTIADPRYLITPRTYTVRFLTLPKYADAGWVGADDETPAGFRWNCSFQVREV